MSLIGKLQNIIEDAKLEYENIQAGNFTPILQSGSHLVYNLHASDEGCELSEHDGEFANLLVRGDNLKLMKHMLELGYKGKVNLIYIDPPFFSKSNYDAGIKIQSDIVKDIPLIKLYAYEDTWQDGMEDYLRMLATCFYMMRDLLSDDGSLWVHLDWHGVHYVKIILDEIFGEKNFVNEVIWAYKSGGTSTKHFSRKHDSLLFYSKTNKYYFKPQEEKSYNRKFKPYRFDGVKEYKDDVGWYTMVNMKDVWQLDMVGRTSKERTGYATQKPEALLERIIASCSKEGDLCADFFCGSGTLASVCHNMGRRWVSCDLGDLAFASTAKRLIKAGANFVALEQVSKQASDDAPGSFNESTSKQGLCGKIKSEVKLDMVVNDLELSDKKMLKIKLVSYKPNVKTLRLDKSAENIVKKIIKEDSLSLIDYWSVDFNYDGTLHKLENVLIPSEDKRYEFEKLESGFKNVNIHVVDVFGQSTTISKLI